MTPFWIALAAVLGQLPVYLAKEDLQKFITIGAEAFRRVFGLLAQICKLNAAKLGTRNQEVLILEDQLKHKHNLRRRYGRLRDAHIRELALLPDYFRQVEDLILAAREQKLSVKEVARLADFTRRLEDSAGKVLEKGLELDQWLKRQKLDENTKEHVLSASVFRTAVVTFLTVVVAVAAIFVNFNLITLPMGELVPADQLVAGISVATISAAVIVLLELVVGIFLLESMGITRLFNFDALAPWQIWVIGSVAFLGLLFLAATEATLAVMREQIVAADALLKADLVHRGSEIATAERSLLPMYGQAALGFSLPWIIAMVGIPLELLVESTRQILGRSLVFTYKTFGAACRVVQHSSALAATFSLAILEVYTSIPRRMFDKKPPLEALKKQPERVVRKK